MCWVMPPASPAATSVSRIASSSDVLPWSTWPMIVTTGGRGSRSSSASSNSGSAVDLVGGVDDLDLLVELVREHLDGVVVERLGERGHLAQLHQLLDDLGDRDAEVLGDVLDRRARVDLDDVGLQDRGVLRDRLRVGAAPAPAAAPRRAPLRAAARAAAGTAGAAGTARAPGGLGVDHDAPHAAGGAGGALALQRGARRRRGRLVAAGLAVAAGLGLGLRLGLRLHALGRARAEVADAEVARRAQLGARRGLGLGAVRARLLLAGQRGVGVGLVHGGSPSPSRRCRRRSAASSPRRWACCTASLARGRASWPCAVSSLRSLGRWTRALAGPDGIRGGRRRSASNPGSRAARHRDRGAWSGGRARAPRLR